MNLVTGATGFLGSYLVKNLLKRGRKVRALRRSSSNFDMLGDTAREVEWVEADLLDLASLERALEGVELIYHCAAVISSLPSLRKNAKLINVDGTANLFNLALDRKVRKVVHVSSVTAFGMPSNGVPIDENYFAPASKLNYDYFLSKRLAELEAWRAHSEGLEMVIVNPSAIIGAGKWSHEPLNIFSTVSKGLRFYTGGSNGFVDVRDVAEVMVRLMEGPINGERFIISAENFELRDFLIMVAEAMGVRPPDHKVNGLMSELAWRYEGIRSKLNGDIPAYTKDDIRIARISFKYNNSKIIKALNYKFIPMEQTVRETAAMFKKSQASGKDYAIFE